MVCQSRKRDSKESDALEESPPKKTKNDDNLDGNDRFVATFVFIAPQLDLSYVLL